MTPEQKAADFDLAKPLDMRAVVAELRGIYALMGIGFEKQLLGDLLRQLDRESGR